MYLYSNVVSVKVGLHIDFGQLRKSSITLETITIRKNSQRSLNIWLAKAAIVSGY